MKHEPNVAVSYIVIGLNESRMIRTCLEAVSHCGDGGERKEIIYVDSGSTDGTLRLVTALPNVTVIHLNDPHPNAAKGRNAGWRAAEGEFIQFLDGDMVMDPDWLGVAFAFMSQRNDIACVFGQLREHREPGNLYSIIFDRIWKYEPGRADTLGGAFLARRSTLAAVGGFDETLRGHEEPDLAARIIRNGGTLWCLPCEMAVHYSGISSFRTYWFRMAAFGSHVEEVSRRMVCTGEIRGDVPKLTRDVLVSCVPPILLVFALLFGSSLVALLALVPVLGFIIRVTAREHRHGQTLAESILYAIHLFFAKYPILCGRIVRKSLLWRKSESMQSVYRAVLKCVYHTVAKQLPSSYSRLGGTWANALRVWICRRLFSGQCEPLHIERRAHIGYWEKVSIGRGSSIGENAYIDAHLTIGDDVMMARDVIILGRNHEFSDTTLPMRLQGFREFEPVSIGNDVWISIRVTILPGVKIGSHSIIAAGAVVTSDVPEFAIVAGVPAKVIGWRSGHARTFAQTAQEERRNTNAKVSQ